jgi:hypothetical protein
MRLGRVNLWKKQLQRAWPTGAGRLTPVSKRVFFSEEKKQKTFMSAWASA